MKTNKSGFTLIEVLIALVITEIAFMGLLTAMDSLRSQMERQQRKWSSERITRNIIALASLPSSIRVTSVQTQNIEAADLFRQVRGWARADHLGPWMPIRLNLPFLEMMGPSNFITAGQFTGDPVRPMRYNRSGELCDTAFSVCPSAQWPIEVFTEYNFSCPPFFSEGYDYLRGDVPYFGLMDAPAALAIPSRCFGKSQMNIRVTVRESADAPNPPEGLIPTTVEVIRMQVGQISRRF
jgi:hypothetical protein